MKFLRNLFLGLFTLVLLVSLAGTATSMGVRLTIGSPDKMKSLLKDSGFYKSFSTVMLDQAKDSSKSSNSDEADFDSSLVQKAAKDALNENFLEEQGNAFIDGNYNWLIGKTKKPEYKIDLGPAREAFAKNTGLALAAKLATLPTCTNAQMATIKAQGENLDPYTLTCLPFTTNPDEEGQDVTKNLSENSSFLNNAVLTPETINPNAGPSDNPYYVSMQKIPPKYQLMLKMPFILAGLALLSTIIVLFCASTKRKGMKIIAIDLVLASLFLILSKVVLDTGFKVLEKKIATGSSDSEALQKSLLNLAHGVEKSLTSFNLYFGTAFLVLAFALVVVLKRSGRVAHATTPESVDVLASTPEKPLVPPTENGITPEAPKHPVHHNQPAENKMPEKKKRPPRLVQ